MPNPESHVELAVAAHAINDLEAVFLIEALEDAGIAATQHGGGAVAVLDGGGAMSLKIFVPRESLDQAREIIDSARAEARERRIDSAFEPDALEESKGEAPQDPKMQAMLELRPLTPEERNEQLSEYVIRWVGEGIDETELARYLSAAGLSREQAAEFVREVVSENPEEINHQRNTLRSVGWSMIGGGILVFLFTIVSAAQYGGFRLGFYHLGSPVLLFVGFAILYLSNRSAPNLERRASISKQEQP